MNIFMCGQGQSNEEGSAGYSFIGQRSKFVSALGYPVNDLIADGTKGASNWFGTTWTLLGERIAAERGHVVHVRNGAVGGTSLIDHWVGQCTTWRSNSNLFGVNQGTWNLPTVDNGKVYCAQNTGDNGLTEPSPWGTVDGANTANGAVNFKCFPKTSADTNGHVYLPGEQGYDPRGYIARIKGIISAAPTGMDKYFLLMSGHQADLGGSRSRTPEIVAQAKINFIEDMKLKFPQLIIYVGLTFYWDTAFEGNPYFRSYSLILDPAIQLVLNHYANDPQVFPGGNMFKSLGTNITYLKNDSAPIHADTPTMLLSPDDWFKKIIASGHI